MSRGSRAALGWREKILADLPPPPTQPHFKEVNFRVEPALWSAYGKMAAKRGVSLSQWVREAMVAQAESEGGIDVPE